MADKFDQLIVTVELWSPDEQSLVKIEEKIPVDGSLSELSGIFHQVHQLMERIRDEKAGISAARRVRGVGACLSSKPEREGG